MKVLMAPVNISGMPLVMVNGLRKLGVDARLIQYHRGEGDFGFAYDTDILVDLDGRHPAETRVETVWNCLDEGYDVFHFWLRTLVFGPKYSGLMGLDLPFIKLYGRRIVYRFTGNDLRDPAFERENNPYSLQRYGYWTSTPEEEPVRKAYIDHLRCYVDAFIVQDPEILSYMPDARVIPRSLELDKWKFIGVKPTDRPLVVHGPSNEDVKGTRFILKACEELKEEGLSFDLKLVKNMAHNDAAAWYRRADIMVDQLHLGAYGVFAMEGMALGKSVICYYREDLFKPVYGDLPIINANPDTIKDVLRRTIKDFEMRKEYGIRARAFVEEHHDHVQVATQMKDVYSEILAAPPMMPSGGADLKFFAMQYASLEKDITRKRALANRAERRLEESQQKGREWRTQVGELKHVGRQNDVLWTRLEESVQKGREWRSEVVDLTRANRRNEALLARAEHRLEDAVQKGREWRDQAVDLTRVNKHNGVRITRADERLEEAIQKGREWRDQAAVLTRDNKNIDARLSRAEQNLSATRSQLKTAQELVANVPPTLRQRARRFGKGALRKLGGR